MRFTLQGCLLFTQDGTVAFLNAPGLTPSFDPLLVQRCERAAKTHRQATLLLPNAFLGSQEQLQYHQR